MRSNIYIDKRIVLIVGAAFLAALSVLNVLIFPEKYFFDSNTILNIIYDITFYGAEFRVLDSYYNTAMLYYVLFDDPVNPPGWMLRLCSAVISWLPVALVMYYANQSRYVSIDASVIFVLGSVLIGIYCGQRSKEMVALWFSALVFWGAYKQKIVFPIVGCLLYGIIFRGYWLIALYFYLSFLLLFYIKPKPKCRDLAILLLFSVIALLIIYSSVVGGFLTDHRFFINDARYFEDNNTIVENLIENSSLITDFINVYLSIIRFVIPIELVVKGGVKYILFFVYWISVVVVFISSTARNAVGSVWSLFVAFLITFSMFEPDFGSFVKHSLVLLPGYFIAREKLYER